MKKSLWGILLVIIFPLPLWGQSPTFNSDRSIVLAFSSNVQGEVEPCG